jgi:hypothetical protein
MSVDTPIEPKASMLKRFSILTPGVEKFDSKMNDTSFSSMFDSHQKQVIALPDKLPKLGGKV